jgi:hypothetical protein
MSVPMTILGISWYLKQFVDKNAKQINNRLTINNRLMINRWTLDATV